MDQQIPATPVTKVCELRTDSNNWPCGNQKVAAIKVTRAVLGYGLKEAKDLVEFASQEPETLHLTDEQIEEFRRHGFDITVSGDINARNTLKEIAAQELLADRFDTATDIVRLLKKHYGG